ncbi:conjugative transposon protein TraJ [Mucilaginibacter myungsuensis]|uniref:Conjugative transposon protein TraJ n=1 Tax=Mucilaginibacter myungsuensis TaxID=649104 RepID=A0A929L4C5_9SPHI|nr:conjugative transposon protein TraJ [Mucilaginibacter myungsuensis]MBE9663001.1 conjugative transposon protein TraJ [Mucilaginibacter myungsuensis]MDN3598631.1 conjugative transposon protein TraJ [Mucilaginibacter myungsuensis]
MKKTAFLTAIIAVTGILFPLFSNAAGLADNIQGLQGTLNSVYNDMLPMCSGLIGVGRAIAGFGALWYIGSRVWRQIAAAEPIDFYPLMRPFALGLAILLFPTVIAIINGIMQPTVNATGGMVQNSDAAIAALLKAKQEAVEKTDTWQMYVGPDGDGDRDKWYKYTHPEDKDGSGEGVLASVGNDMKFAMAKASYNFRNTVKQWMSEVLQVLYEAAALCINTIRTFYLIILAILGPIVFGLAVFDGFQSTLTVWLAKYINVFLWLPVANIFGAIIGKVQENMLKLDISQVQSAGDTFFSSTDTAYLIFLIIGIIGYFTVPSVANYIVNAGSGHGLLQKVNALVITSSNTTVAAGSQVGERMVNGAINLSNAPGDFMNGWNNAGQETKSQPANHQAARINGN